MLCCYRQLRLPQDRDQLIDHSKPMSFVSIDLSYGATLFKFFKSIGSSVIAIP